MNQPPRIAILLYHSIASNVQPGYQPFAIEPATFRRHLDLVAAEGYQPVTVSQLVARMAASPAGGAGGEGGLSAKVAVLTFDDGFLDFYTTVLPELVARGFPASLYVVAGLMGGRSEWLRNVGEQDRPLMTPAMVREVADLGIECGSHGLFHRPLDAISRRDAAREVAVSKRALEDVTGHAVHSIAYPYGYHDRWLRNAVIDEGYTSGAAVKNALSHPLDDQFGLARLTVTAATTTDTLKAWLSGEASRIAPSRERPITTAWRLVRRTRGLLEQPATGPAIGF